MEIKQRTLESVVVLDLKGRLVLGDGDRELKDRVNGLMRQGYRQFLLNFAGVSYIDSCGVGELVAAYTTVVRQGGQVKLLNLTKRSYNLLTIVKLLTVFDCFDAEEDALRSFPSMVGR